MVEKNDTLKQRKISDMFRAGPPPPPGERPQQRQEQRQEEAEMEDNPACGDIEDLGGPSGAGPTGNRPMVTKRKRATSGTDDSNLTRSWRVVLG